MAKRKSQSDHDIMVRKIIEEITKTGYSDIRADLPNEKKPDLINNCIPDVTGKIPPWLFIFEVETDDSIDDSHTESQWKTFADYAIINNERFVVVIPLGSKNKAENRLNKLGITAQIREIS